MLSILITTPSSTASLISSKETQLGVNNISDGLYPAFIPKMTSSMETTSSPAPRLRRCFIISRLVLALQAYLIFSLTPLKAFFNFSY